MMPLLGSKLLMSLLHDILMFLGQACAVVVFLLWLWRFLIIDKNDADSEPESGRLLEVEMTSHIPPKLAGKLPKTRAETMTDHKVIDQKVTDQKMTDQKANAHMNKRLSKALESKTHLEMNMPKLSHQPHEGVPRSGNAPLRILSGHISIDLDHSVLPTTESTALSLFLHARNGMKLAHLPAIHFDRMEKLELELFELEKCITEELQLYLRSTSDIHKHKLALVLYLVRLRSIYRGSAVSEPSCRPLLIPCCYRILTNHGFLRALSHRNLATPLASFVIDSAFFLGPSIDAAFPGILASSIRLANSLLQDHKDHSPYTASLNQQDLNLQHLDYMWTMCLLQTATTSTIGSELRIFVDTVADPGIDDRIKVLVVDILGLFCLAKRKLLGSTNLIAIDSLIRYCLEYPNLEVRRAMALSFEKYKGCFPVRASRIVAELSEPFRDDLLSNLRVREKSRF